MNGRQRVYRSRCEAEGLVRFEVREGETDLLVLAAKDLRQAARKEVRAHRAALCDYLLRRPEFATSFHPLAVEPSAPLVVRMMSEASFLTGTGPMASVAGVLAELVGRALLPHSPEVIVENGGDIFLRTNRPTTVAIWAGSSVLSGRVGVRVAPAPAGAGVATSSGTVGHSYSAGSADAVTVVAESAPTADGMATCLGNMVRSSADFERVRDAVAEFPFVKGVVIILGKELFAWGDISLVSL